MRLYQNKFAQRVIRTIAGIGAATILGLPALSSESALNTVKPVYAQETQITAQSQISVPANFRAATAEELRRLQNYSSDPKASEYALQTREWLLERGVYVPKKEPGNLWVVYIPNGTFTLDMNGRVELVGKRLYNTVKRSAARRINLNRLRTKILQR